MFAKARTLTNLMLEVTKSTEPGRALLQTFNRESSYNSLNALATHAKKAYLESAPCTGKIDGEKARSTGRDAFYNSGRLGT